MKRVPVRNFVSCLLAASIVLAANSFRSQGQERNDPGARNSGSSNTEATPSPIDGNAPSAAKVAGENSKVPLSEFAWLDGRWQGNWGPRVAEQVWMGPRAGEIPGLFRVVENDKTLVLEVYSLIETPDGIELRLRHFTPSLVPWEQSSMSILKLVSVDSNEAAFENTSPGQPGRLTLIRIDAESYMLRTEISSDSENKQVTEIRYHKVKSPAEEAPSQKKKKSEPRTSPH